MKGLKINYKGKNTIAAVKDGDLLVVDMHDVRGESFFMRVVSIMMNSSVGFGIR